MGKSPHIFDIPIKKGKPILILLKLQLSNKIGTLFVMSIHFVKWIANLNQRNFKDVTEDNIHSPLWKEMLRARPIIY